MKKLLIAIAVLSSMVSCVDHPERKKVEEKNPSQFRKRLIKEIGSQILMPMDMDTIYKVGDTTWILKQDIYVVVVR